MSGTLPEIVFLTTPSSPIHPVAEKILKDRFKVKHVPAPGWSFDEAVLRNVAEASAILVRVGVVTEEVMRAAPKLRMIAVHGIGIDRVDLEAAENRKIVVTNTPLANTAAVAEHTIGLILCLIKRIPISDQLIKSGKWREAHSELKELMNMTVGIIGFGNIGTKVAKRLRPFEVHIVSYDPYVPMEEFGELGVKAVDLATLLRESDIVTLHVPLTRHTRHMIGKNELGRMKRSAFLVNTSRGSVIDQDALYNAMCGKLISGAALDVFEEEPPPQDSPLLELGDVVLTPHAAGTTEESVKRTAETAAKDIVRLFSGERPVHEYRKESLPYPV